MKSILRSFALAAAAALFAAAPLRSQSGLPVSETVMVGGVTTQSSGQAWAYLFWQTDSLDLLRSRTYSIWQKSGDANSANAFTRIGVVTLQSDPSAVSGILERATAVLGEDPVALDQTVSALFGDLMPTLTQVPAAQRLPHKISAVLRGVTADPRQLQSLVLASRHHPTICLSVGQAYAAKIPSSGPVTFEVREYSPASKTDVATLGRVTLDASTPLPLPVPTLVRQVADSTQQGFNSLNVKLVWDTPDALRRVLPLTQGFNLFRVKRSVAEQNGWQNNAPQAAQLASLALGNNTGVGRVNRAAIVPKKPFTVAEVMTAQTGDQFFTDDVSRMPGYPNAPQMPKNGDQYYYFVTTRDALGRDAAGAASPGVLATFCDRGMPDTPTGLKVTNEYGYNNGAAKQFLRLTWRANDNSGAKKTTGYVVYRWTTPDGPLALTGNPGLPVSRDPLAFMIAGPIPHVEGQATFSYDDTGAGAPSTSTDLNQTFWYSVRAIDNGSFDAAPGGPFCNVPPFGGNLSANSPTAYGTLRSRTGPAAPTGIVSILCPVPAIAPIGAVRVADPTLDPNRRYVELIATRLANETNIEAVDFEAQLNNVWTPLGRVHFSGGETTVTRKWSGAVGTIPTGATVRARAVTANGDASAFASITYGDLSAGFIARCNWVVAANYVRVPLNPLVGGGRCSAHTPPPADSGVVAPNGNGVLVEFVPPTGTKQYKLYARVDNGPLTLMKEDSQNFPPGQLLQVVGDLLPAATSQVCLYLQVFDVDGNPSPMTALGCMTFKGAAPLAKPMLAPIASGGTEAAPQAQIQWFCPPVGIDHFDVWISSSPSDLPPQLATTLNQDGATPTGMSLEKIGGGFSYNFTYQIYNTERLGPAFGNGGAIFAVQFPVALGQKLRVKIRAVSEAGDHGPFSNVETYTWAPAPTFTGPDVPWPQRPLPAQGSAAAFSGPVAPFYFGQNGWVGIALGQTQVNSRTFTQLGREVVQLQGTQPVESYFYTADFKNPDTTRHALPCLLYRTQVPDLPAPPSKPLANFPTVPGDIVQVSPLIESIATATEAYPGGGNGVSIYDPFIHVETVNLAGTRLNAFYLKDTTPVVSGARYVYLLVLLDPVTKEIERVLPLAPIDIP
ncbi:MAG: hypothetical protein JSR82_09805 [Verrucomicrobia bacterium]|nr:hypothetical protein [Verrucomicrobiota bacterium]